MNIFQKIVKKNLSNRDFLDNKCSSNTFGNLTVTILQKSFDFDLSIRSYESKKFEQSDCEEEKTCDQVSVIPLDLAGDKSMEITRKK
jgi:hypothetical protein